MGYVAFFSDMHYYSYDMHKTERNTVMNSDQIYKDYMVQGMALNNEVRFFAATTKDLVEKARTIHQTSPVCTAALGRLLTAGVLMSPTLKNEDDILTLKINGDGPAKSLTVTTNVKGEVKGIIYNPLVIVPANSAGHLNVGAAVGAGTLTVIRDLGLGEPYAGTINLVSGEIAEDLTYYYAESEQIPTSVGLGVLMNKNNTVSCAGGFIIQLMPFASEETISRLEKGLAEFSSVTDVLSEGLSPEEMIDKIIGDESLVITGRKDVSYKCNCSFERVSKALISLGKKELQKMIDDNEPITVNCEFCKTSYTFEIDDLKNMIGS